MLIDAQTTKQVLDQYGIQIKGILHVGAHKCEEKNVYNSWGVQDDKIIWVDANQDLVSENLARGIPNCYCAVLDETEQETKFKITNNGESSSLLDFGSHKDSYPHIVVVKEIDVKTQTLSNFLNANSIDITNHNIWNFDIQGSELSVFKGSKELLAYADCIYAEVNSGDVYKGCGKVTELDELLSEYGLTRVLTRMTDANWGDAIYVRTHKSI
jgi:FkbM family methyltransferase